MLDLFDGLSSNYHIEIFVVRVIISGDDEHLGLVYIYLQFVAVEVVHKLSHNRVNLLLVLLDDT